MLELERVGKVDVDEWFKERNELWKLSIIE